MLMKRLLGIGVMLLLSTMPALAVTLNGTVTYRERIALPANATLEVALIDLTSGARVSGARAAIPATGQVPLGFTLNVRSDVSVAGRYGLFAEIAVPGGILFRNATPQPVDIAGTGLIEILVSHSPAPAPQPPAEPAVEDPIAEMNPLLETIWTVTSIGGDPSLPDREPTLSIAADLRAGGHGGCNNYFTEAMFDDTDLTFGPVAGTRMACADAIMAQETRFFAALAATAGYRLDGDALRLLDAAGVTLVGLVRAP